MKIIVSEASGAPGGGPRVTLVDIKTTDRIKAVRAKILSAVGIPTRSVSLSMGGTILEDQFTVADYNVKPNATPFAAEKDMKLVSALTVLLLTVLLPLTAFLALGGQYRAQTTVTFLVKWLT